MKKLVLLIGLSATGCSRQWFPLAGFLNGHAQTAPAQPGTANIPVVILAGQSQMLGGAASAPVYVNGMEWRGLDYPRGIGPEFAAQYLRQTGRPEVIMIQCAVGGTSIVQWAPGGTLQTQCEGFYEQVLREFPTAKVATVLFWQGEADVVTPGTPWAAEFTTLVRRWRDLWGNVPVEFCQIAINNNPVGWPYWSYIQAQQAGMSLPNTAMVTTMDVGDISSDGLHMTEEGLEIVGDKLARAYFGLID
jgi:hypothetical protein